MSDQFDNGKAPQPPLNQGGDEARTEGTEPGGSIMLSTFGASLKPLSFWASVAWCVAAGVCAGISPLIAPLFVGFAFVLLAGNGGVRERAIAAAALIVPAVAVALLTSFAGIEDAVFACIAGIVGASLYLSGKLTPGISCMAVAGLGLMLLAASEGLARMAGTSLGALFGEILDMYLGSMESLSIEYRMVVDRMRVIVDAIWPTAFFMIAFFAFILSIGGAQVAARRQLVPVANQQPLELFDLPLWVVGCLIAAVLILAASQAIPAYSGALMMLGGTMVGSLRLAFATQGFAVLSWFKRTRGWRGLVGLVISAIAVYLEFNMFVLTIVGVLDVWINMRHLNRGARVTIQDPTDQS